MDERANLICNVCLSVEARQIVETDSSFIRYTLNEAGASSNQEATVPGASRLRRLRQHTLLLSTAMFKQSRPYLFMLLPMSFPQKSITNPPRSVTWRRPIKMACWLSLSRPMCDAPADVPWIQGPHILTVHVFLFASFLTTFFHHFLFFMSHILHYPREHHYYGFS